ncbi:MAG TPA: DNA polymerase III subunit alpha [Solirubrobacteraceae bacterium]|jgi:error-prone DNA polymerase|nr:DNA polymerase III subunit alpha [Solirubrobacteraceae bacterium]
MYVELHCHSAFSFLDGASLPDELVSAALELGYEALALTDHNSVSGSMEFAVSAQGLGLRAIQGAEVNLEDGRHLTLLVEDATGWSSLCRILTRAHAHTREGRGPPSQASVPLTEVLEHADGLVCLSGCALRGVHDEPTLLRLREVFGRDRLRIELQRPFLRDDRARNRQLARVAERLRVPCVATGNVHAHARSRAPLQDAFVAVRVHATLDASEPERRGNFSHVLASPAAMAARFAEHPEAVAESAVLADRLRFDLGADLGYRYPGAEDAGTMRKLSELCGAQLQDRYADAEAGIRERAGARLEEELRLIDALALPGFFVLHHDLLELAREVAVEVRGPDTARALLPPGRGRGSSVSSIVCYLTGLSHVDPIANELLIGRFLNEELTSLPDIDLDFPRDVREVLIPRVHERYGHDRSALVAAFPTYRARGAIRELGKVLGLPPGEIERVARGSEGWDAREVGADIENAFGGAAAETKGSGGRGPGPFPSHRSSRTASSGRWAWLARLSAEAQGLPRHLSQHSGGMIVATRPLVDCCPIVPAAMEGRQIVQWDKDSCADAGFLKIDLLGLGMLSAVERAVELIARNREERIDLSRIPYDDPATYECIQNADTTGVFQIESRAQMQSLRRTRPESLEDITIQVAIVRPGPIQGGAVNPYIERRQRLRADPDYEIPYLHPSLEPALRETLGTIIFQDQVLEVSIAFAGFSPGEAEGLRRAMSRKRSDAAIRAHHDRFIAGAQRTHGVDEATAEEVFAMVKGFSGFGFPKAHGAAFGLLAYQSTWLRVHYGPEFLCSLMNEQPMGFYPPDALVHEAQRRGITVLPPDVNESEVECEIDSHGQVRIGLGYIRSVRRHEVEEIVAARRAGGRFRGLADLASRASAGASSLELLAWSGAVDSVGAAVESRGATVEAAGAASTESIASFAGAKLAGVGGDDERRASGAARRIALWQLGVATPGRGVPGGTQLALPLDLPAPPSLRKLSQWESMLADYGTTGLTTQAHPLALLRERLPADAVSSRDLETLTHGVRIRTAGLVVARQRPGTANGIVFVLLEDEYGTINLIVPPPIYERHRLTVRTEPLVIVEGKLERFAAAGGAISVFVHRIAPISTPDRPIAEVKDFSMLDERERRRIAEEKAAAAAAPAAAEAAAAAEAEDFRAVAPAVMSFASGRRR